MITKKSPLYNQTQLKYLCDNLCDNIDNLLEYFNLEFRHLNRSTIAMKCPIHEGDNDTALNIYHEGNSYRGNWKCRTHQCEKIFKESILGFIRGILSNKKYGWSKSGDKVCTFNETIEFAKNFINCELDDIKVDKQQQEKQIFNRLIENIKKDPNKEKTLITKEIVKSALIIPAEYYIDRGYSREILIKYDIGFCNRLNKEMTNRVVAPIYDIDNEYVVGCSGRSIFNKCDKCKCYHEIQSDCPDKLEYYKYSKWKHSSGFKAQNHLYNIWFAKKFIKETGIVLIVESPGNVWKLEENGIHNSVGIFGSSMSDRQKIILDGSGAMKMVVLTDNDEAGEKAAENIIKKCSKTYQIYRPKISKPDIGEMTTEEINIEIKNFIEGIQ